MNFKNKKIAILGFGIEGVDAVKYCFQQGAIITVFDQKKFAQLGKEVGGWKRKGVDFITGEKYLDNGLTNFDYIIRSPSFWRYMPEITDAEKNGVIITSTIKFFFNNFKGKIIGVTGTKGKGTTSTLIFEILKAAGVKTTLAGNIGKPVLSLLNSLTIDDLVVLELSSFQLQDLDKSPDIAVVLFITSEHLDVHKSTLEYIEAKSNIVKHQTKNDFAILNYDNKNSLSFAKITKAQKIYFSRLKKTNGSYVLNKKIYLNGQLLGDTKNLLLRGEHNWDNITAAISAAHVLNVDINVIKQIVFSFKGLEHRLELVANKSGIQFYNDSFSTNPETAIAAVKSFSEPIILILGGSDKGSDFNELGKIVADSTVKTIILIGEMADKILASIKKYRYKGNIIIGKKDMKSIVETAVSLAKPGDVILLSPACASFDMFANYKDRGEQFKENVQKIK